MLFRKIHETEFLDLSRIVYEATHQCSRGCIYCYNYWKAPDTKKNNIFSASYSSSKKTLKQLFKIYPVKQITFTGGEPLLAERLPELILYSKQKGARVNLITGGGGSISLYRKLLYSPPDQFQLPFHSADSEIHDSMMRYTGAHRAVKEKISFLQDHKIKTAAVLILTKLNIHTLEETLNELKKMGIRILLVNRFDPGGSGLAHIENLELNPVDLNKAYTLLNKFSSPDFLIYSGINTPQCLLDKTRYPAIGFGGCKVHLGSGPITVDAEGNLRLCNQSQHIIGNIHKNSLKEMAVHQISLQWKNSVPELCKNCNLFNECQAGCRASGEQQGLSAMMPDPYLIRYLEFRK